jgi:hypothetical protein
MPPVEEFRGGSSPVDPVGYLCATPYHFPCKPCNVFAAYHRAPNREARSLTRSGRRALRSSLQPVGGAQHPVAAAVQHMGVHHGRAHVGVAEQFLHGANVVAIPQQIRAKRMARGFTVLPMNRFSQPSSTGIIRSMTRKSKFFGERAATG